MAGWVFATDEVARLLVELGDLARSSMHGLIK
jgi:hypothetical protein